MRTLLLVLALLPTALGAGCGAPEPSARPSVVVPTPGPLPAGSAEQPGAGSGAGSPGIGSPGAGSPGRSDGVASTPPTRATSGGWLVTVYYTAVERFHSGSATSVTGCPRIDCARGSADLGRYPASFVAAVRDEGTGRTNAGRYLNWSHDTGFWLDDAPRDTAGRALRPFESAAADPGVLRGGSSFSIVGCGRDDDGGSIAEPVCTRLRAARWTVTDEFTPGLGGDRHVDVYLGEETAAGFTDSDWYTTLRGATLAVQR